MAQQELDLSIIIVNYNSINYLRDCIKSIRKTTKEIRYEIIVVDNNSQDGSVGIIRNEFQNVLLIANQNNAGLSCAWNQGIRVSRGHYILLLNNDTVLLPDSLDTMWKVMERSPGIGLLGCRLLNSDGSLQQSFGNVISIYNDFIQKFFINLYEQGRNPIVGKYLRWTHSTPKEVDWVKGANMMLRRETIYDVGLLDENYFMYMEEVDLSLRVKQLGWKVYYSPETEIIHCGGGSTATNRYNAALAYRKSQLYFYNKHYGKWGLIRLKGYLYFKMGVQYFLENFRNRLGRKNSPESQERSRFVREILAMLRQTH